MNYLHSQAGPDAGNDPYVAAFRDCMDKIVADAVAEIYAA